MPKKATSTAVAVATTPAPSAPVQYLVRTNKPFTSKVKHNQTAVASIVRAIAKGVPYATMCSKANTPITGGRPGTQHTVARYMVNRLGLFKVTTSAPSAS